MINLHSRIHKLSNYTQSTDTTFIKRDDELSCGISGSKYRKFSSIIPKLIKNKVKHVYIIGSTHSNNVLAALQSLREHQFQITALLLKSHNNKYNGNFKLSQLFLRENEIIWIDRTEWPNVEKIAQNLSSRDPIKNFILSEGSQVKEGIKGAMSLAYDILKNETNHKIKFDHIFFDAGTGFSASCCIKHLEKINHSAQCHVLLLAGTKQAIIEKNQTIITDITWKNTHFFTPTNAKSFGSINTTVKNFIKQFAYQHGILLDPIYSAKLLFEAQIYIDKETLKGNILIIHSGGILTLPHFDITG